MKQVNIRPNEFLEFMDEDNYWKFIEYLKTKLEAQPNDAIWIIAECEGK